MKIKMYILDIIFLDNNYYSTYINIVVETLTGTFHRRNGMENTLYASHEQLYVKFTFTPDDWGVGITLYLDHPGFEIAVRLLCWQVWIGR
jgi:hypothetical protein